MKIERGTMVMKDGKAWGVEYSDGYCTQYGWIDPATAPIHSMGVKKPSDIAYKGAHWLRELETGTVVVVERVTTVKVLPSVIGFKNFISDKDGTYDPDVLFQTYLYSIGYLDADADMGNYSLDARSNYVMGDDFIQALYTPTLTIDGLRHRLIGVETL